MPCVVRSKASKCAAWSSTGWQAFEVDSRDPGMKKPIATPSTRVLARSLRAGVGAAAGLLLLTLGIAAQSPSAYNGPRTPDRKPDLNGIWQVLGTAHWNLEAHSASEGVPAGFSVVEGGTIPYQPSALARRNENFQNRLMADPLRKCYMPGVPRATYLPFPFEVTQTPNHVGIAYEFAHATRTESGKATRWSSTPRASATRPGSTRQETSTATRSKSSNASRRWTPPTS